MSYSNSFPTQRPTLNLDFANSGKLDSRISYARSSTGTALSSERHLSSENLVPYSNLSSGFSVGRTTIASTNNSAPDGGSDAASILETADPTSSHEVYTSFSCVSGQQYSFVFYLKANGRTKAMVRPQMTSVIADVEFDLTAVTSTVVSGSANSHSITAIGSTGWYKCAVTVTATVTGTGFTQFNLLDAGGNIAYTGDVTKGMFAWGASVSSTGETVLNETSGQIHREYAPTLKTASANEPRFEYTADGESEGLLIEAQSSNLFTRSSGFDYTAAWTKINVTATAEAISPDGTLNAFAIRENTTTGTKRIYQAATVAAGAVAVSVYAKLMGNERRLVIREDSTTGDSAVFDLSSGTVAATNVGGAGTIESVGNGWYRCTLITSPSGSPGYQFGFWLATATGTNYETYTGDGYSGVLLFGAQVQNALAASSYIETLGSTATRSADSCSVATADIGYTGGPVSIVSEFSGGTGYYPQIFELRDTVSKAGGVNDYILPVKYSAAANDSTDWRVWINESDNLTQTTISSSSSATQIGVSVDTNSVASCADGGTIYNATSTVIPDSLDTLYIGRGYSSTISINGHIKRVALYNVALSDTELQALTS